jgi:hypothetical protein
MVQCAAWTELTSAALNEASATSRCKISKKSPRHLVHRCLRCSATSEVTTIACSTLWFALTREGQERNLAEARPLSLGRDVGNYKKSSTYRNGQRRGNGASLSTENRFTLTVKLTSIQWLSAASSFASTARKTRRMHERAECTGELIA